MNPLQHLNALGQSPWLDYISRDLMKSGGLQGMINQGIVGVTSNPAIFQKAISSSDAYDAEISELADQGLGAVEIYERLAIADIQRACDGMRGIYDSTDGQDGMVSLEVNPHLARDTQGTIEEGKRLHAAVNRPNVMIKVPATKEGIPAIEALTAAGIHVNVTLLFSLSRYQAAADAFVAGARQTDQKVESVASFFVSRVDSLVDPKLEPHGLKGKAAIAWSRAAYDLWLGMEDAKAELAVKGIRMQRLLWASTSTKDPSYSKTMYVEALAGPHTVNTLPTETIEATLQMSHAPTDQLSGKAEETKATLEQIAQHVSLEEAAVKLENEGIAKFVEPFDTLIAAIDEKRKALA